MAVNILVPPGVPKIIKGSPSFSIMLGDMLDKGIFPGSGALGESGLWEKSSISLFMIIPTPGTMTPEPKK